MITIFCDFRQFSANKIGVFLKTDVMIKIFPSLPKNANFFAEFFGETIFKIITSVPGHVTVVQYASFLSHTSTKLASSVKS
jgi:hypothetical protein